MNLRTFFFLLITVCTIFLTTSSGYCALLKESKGDITFLFYTADNPVRFIIVEKSTQKLMLFEQQETLKLLKTFTSATGENPGTKRVSGDSRTPEGFYYLTEIYEDNKITVFGSRAFHLDYPNVFDSQNGHQGNGIFIHGTNKPLIPYSTNGCITLNNADLDELAPYLTVNSIPIIVVDILTEPVLGQNLRLMKNDSRFNKILEELSVDTRTFSKNNINTLYFLKRGSQAIASVNYSVYDGDLLQYRYQKRVYLTPAVTEDWRTLFAVQNQATAPTILAVHPVKYQSQQPLELTELTERPENPRPTTDLSKELMAFVEKWRAAWSNKDTETYMDCYSPSFRSGRMDREAWRKKKSYLNSKYRYIKVSIRNIVIDWTASGANVSFLQDYQSDQYKISGTKFLQLINRGNKWLIQKEIM